MRLTYEQRRSAIVAQGVILANRDGLQNVTRKSLSDFCDLGTSEGTVRYYFPTQAMLWGAIAGHGDASDKVRRTAQILGITT